MLYPATHLAVGLLGRPDREKAHLSGYVVERVALAQCGHSGRHLGHNVPPVDEPHVSGQAGKKVVRERLVANPRAAESHDLEVSGCQAMVYLKRPDRGRW